MRIENKIFYCSISEIVFVLFLFLVSVIRWGVTDDPEMDFFYFAYPFGVIAAIEGILASKYPSSKTARRFYYEITVAHLMGSFVFFILAMAGDNVYEEIFSDSQYTWFCTMVAFIWTGSGIWFRWIALDYLTWLESAEIAAVTKPSPIF